MKTFRILSLMAIAIITITSCMSAPMPTKEELTVERITNDLKQTKSELYNLSNQWFVDSFNSAEAVIEYQNEDNGILMGKFTYESHVSAASSLRLAVIDYVKCTIKVQIKDNAVKVTISDPSIHVNGGQYGSDWRLPNSKEIEDIKYFETSNSTIDSYIQYLNSINSDW